MCPQAKGMFVLVHYIWFKWQYMLVCNITSCVFHDSGILGLFLPCTTIVRMASSVGLARSPTSLLNGKLYSGTVSAHTHTQFITTQLMFHKQSMI